MGELWVARHLELELEMALKLIAPGREGSESAERRFRREARAAAKLKSPYIATIHDFGRSGGHLFIAMELLEGQDLSAHLQTGPMRPGEALFVVEQLCRALTVTHEAGIIHRDLKPSNIFLAEHGTEVMTKLLDFGIAKAFGDRDGDHETQSTETGVRVGSPGYMSPEQVFGDGVTPESDVWALGCVAYEMLAGVLPFYGAAPGRRYTEIVAGNVLPLELEGYDGAALMSFFRRCLSASPEERHPSPNHFHQGLREALGELEPQMPSLRSYERPRRGPAATMTLSAPASEERTPSEVDPASGPPSPSDQTGAYSGEATSPRGFPSPVPLRAVLGAAVLVAGLVVVSSVVPRTSPPRVEARRLPEAPSPPATTTTTTTTNRAEVQAAPPATATTSSAPTPSAPRRAPRRTHPVPPAPSSSVDAFSGLPIPVAE